MRPRGRWVLFVGGSHAAPHHILDGEDGYKPICPNNISVPRTKDGGLDGNKVVRSSDSIGDVASGRRVAECCRREAVRRAGSDLNVEAGV